MSNVVAFVPRRERSRPLTAGDLVAGFARERRSGEDVFWLKENAELLNILLGAGLPVAVEDLAPLAGFYADLEARLRFFPQYYRFLLSMALDLEDLGLPGETRARLCAEVARAGLAEAELSDLQRAEARRLLARRGLGAAGDEGLEARLRAFMARSETFAVPNKKAAYELTHIVFYLSDYGARDPGLCAGARRSLRYAGILAYLDQNADLLAEVCTALHFAGEPVPRAWRETVAAVHRGITADGPAERLEDAYHEYLVTGWFCAATGGDAFAAPGTGGPLRFAPAGQRRGALRVLSECLYGLGEARRGDWRAMRPHVLAMLGPVGHEVLVEAEAATDVFEPFFESFARVARF